MEVKDLIRCRRQELNLTMADVAKAVGVSEATVSRWESGNIPNMRRDRMNLLAKVLQISPLQLLDGHEEAPRNDFDLQKFAADPRSGDPELDELRRRFTENLQKMDKTQLAMFVQLMDQVLK